MDYTPYITDREGKRVSVVLPMKDYQHMSASLEELEDMRCYDAAKATKDTLVPMEEAFHAIEAQHNQQSRAIK